MAGVGPPPSERRQRSQEPARGDWVDLPEIAKPVLPALSSVDAARKWRPWTRRMWNAWRKDRVTSQYSPSDIAYAEDTIRLLDESPSARAGEVRLRMDALGLTPKGKRDLRYRLPSTTDGRGEEPRRHANQARVAARRARLAAVE